MSVEDAEQIEEMAVFFDARAAGYDDYLRDKVFDSGARFTESYHAVASPIQQTDEPLSVLDLGCGTGLEIEALLQQAPNVLITGVDVSGNMLERLQHRFSGLMSQITLVADSYLSMPLGSQAYDYVVSVLALHHLLPDA